MSERKETFFSDVREEIAADRGLADSLLSLCVRDEFGRVEGERLPGDGSRRIGLFYFLWNGYHRELQPEILDNTRLLFSADKNWWRPKSREGQFENCFHYWGKPLYGYYDACDPWVIHKHIRLFVLMGIDFVAFDVTNGVTYDEAAETYMRITCEYLAAGIPAPRVVFYCNTNTCEMAEHYYRTIYQPGRFRESWYLEEGKPLLIGSANERRESGRNLDDLSDELKDFFFLRPNVWAMEKNRAKGIPWIDFELPPRNIDGCTSVSVSQHTAHPFSLSVDCDADETAYHSNRGRGFDPASGKNRRTGIRRGDNLQAQWETALSNGSDTAFVTGWNEWIAQKLYNYLHAEGKFSFVDTVNEEFSRDLEMEDGSLKDSAFLQNFICARRYREGNPVHYRGLQGSVKLAGGRKEFRNKGRIFYDFQGTQARDFEDATGKSRYRQPKPPNDILTCTVVNDKEFLWFGIETAEKIVETDGQTLNILIAMPNAPCGKYAFCITRKSGESMLVRRQGRNRNVVCKLNNVLEENFYGVEIPLSALELEGDFCFDFKLTDHIGRENWGSFYRCGEVVPLGRLNFRYHCGIEKKE